MGAHTAIPVGEYLDTRFTGLDREYRDGELVERTLPDYLHGKVQGLLFLFFALLRKKMPVYPAVETRLRIGPNRVLIPDVSVFYPSEPERVPDFPPLVVIEVLSIDDRFIAVQEKLSEYKAWGVRHVWLVDPHSRKLHTFDATLREVAAFTVPELGVELKPTDIFD